MRHQFRNSPMPAPPDGGKSSTDRLLPWLETLAARGATILIGDPGRTYFPRGRFEHLAEYSVPVSRALEDSEIKRTSVWRLG